MDHQDAVAVATLVGECSAVAAFVVEKVAVAAMVGSGSAGVGYRFVAPPEVERTGAAVGSTAV